MKTFEMLLWVLPATILLSFSSCRDTSSARDILSDAEMLLDSSPDSALCILRGVDSGRLRGRGARAEHSLLLSMALDKNYIDLTSDSLINIAVGHYRRHRDHERHFLSLYYQGRVHENAGRYSRAMVSFTEAERIIDNVDNDYAKGLLYSHLGKLNDRFYNFSRSLEMFEKAEHFYHKAERIAHQYYSKLSIGCAYMNQNRYDSAERILMEVFHWGCSHDPAIARDSRELLYSLYMRTGDSSKYLALHSGDAGDIPPGNSALAYRHALRDDAPNALRHLELAWRDAETIQDTIGMYACSYRVKKLLGDFSSALSDHERLLFAQDTTVRSALRQPLLAAQRDHYLSLAENRALELKSNRILLMCGLIIAALCLTLIISYYRHQLVRKQRNLDDYIGLHHELERLVSDKNCLIAEQGVAIHERDMHLSEMAGRISDKDVEIDAVNTKVRTLFSRQYELLDQLCKTCYENPGSNKEKAIYSTVKREIDSFSSDGEILGRLEQIVNEYNGGVMRKLRSGMPSLSPKDYRMLCFLYAGFSAKAISVFTNDTINNIYVKKKRLKDKIADMKPEGWKEMIEWMG